MLSIILFILIISSFSFFAAFRLDKTYESTIGVSCMAIILFLFLTGMINILGIGWILTCIVAVGLYVYTIYWIYKSGVATLKSRLFNLITPGSILFVVLAGMIAYFNQDRLAMHTDEFSHWLDTVVIMCRLDAFGTAPDSTAIFPSYPPAMSLFQYLLEKINIAFTGDFSEWKVYFAYQLLAVAIMIRFVDTKGDGITKKAVSIISWPVCLFLPLLFFSEVYSSLYIDPFLGVLGGCGFAAVSVSKEKDWMYNTYLTTLCGVLVLAKDVGIYLAIFISLYFLIDYLARGGVQLHQDAKVTVRQAVIGLLPMIAMIASKLLWKIELSVSGTTAKFSQPFDLSGTIDTLKGNGTEFTTAVYDAFRQAITYRYVYYERLGFNYSSILFLLILAFICLQVSAYRRGRLKKNAAIAGAVIPSVAIVAYIFSMFPLYISRFVEEEALSLASFDRYCGIMFLTGVLLMLWLLRDMLIDADGRVIPVVLAAGMLLSMYHAKQTDIAYYTERQSVKASIEYRQAVDILGQKIKDNCDEDARILMVGESSDDAYAPILSTTCKPRWFIESSAYFSATPDENGTVALSIDEFRELLINNFDYVAIYRPTETITTVFAGVFSDISQVGELTLFAVGPDGTLTLVE